MAKNGFRVMDSDMHLMEPGDLWEKYIAPEYKERAPRCNSLEPRDFTVEVEGQLIPIPQAHLAPENLNFRLQVEEIQAKNYQYAMERNWDGGTQLKAMDDEGIDVAVLYPSRGLMPLGMDGLDPELAGAIATAYNDWLNDFCQADPGRMYGAAMAAPHNIPSAVKEIRRSVEKFGFKGVFLRPNMVGGRNWHDHYYDPLWAECETAGVPIGFHEGGRVRLPQVGSQFETDSLYHTLSHPVQMMIAVVSMIGGGVLQRYPKLNVAFLEANCSWVPWLIWRLGEHLTPAGEGSFSGRLQHPDLKLDAVEYFKRQCYVSLEPDEEPAKYVVDWLGDDNIVFSTDYPHLDSKYPEAVNLFLDLDLPDATKRKMLWDNCARFYGFVGAPATAI